MSIWWYAMPCWYTTALLAIGVVHSPGHFSETYAMVPAKVMGLATLL